MAAPRRSLARWLLAGGLLLLTAATLAGDRQQGTASIQGQVMDAGNGSSIAAALVELGGGATAVRMLADAQGRFTFENLSAGTYTLAATRRGYMEGAHGRGRPRGQPLPIVLRDGQQATAEIPVWKFGALAGRVVDEAGDPMIGTTIQALRRYNDTGRPTFAFVAIDRTDDRGMYRMGSLEPGEYLVCMPANQATTVVVQRANSEARDAQTGASSVASLIIRPPANESSGTGPDGRPWLYPTTFYPAARSSALATIVALGSGEERSGIDLTLRPAPTRRVAGTLITSRGAAGGMAVTLRPAASARLASPTEMSFTITDSAGTFLFPSVPAGDYLLEVSGTPSLNASRAPGPAADPIIVIGTRTGSDMTDSAAMSVDIAFWARTNVTVETTDITGLVIALQTGLAVQGRFEWQGDGPTPSPDSIALMTVMLEPDGTSTAKAIATRAQRSGTFSTGRTLPGRYFVQVTNPPTGWFLHGAVLNGRNVTDSPLELQTADATDVTLVFTNRQTELSGSISRIATGNSQSIAVVVFPADQPLSPDFSLSPRRVRSVVGDLSGSYRISGLPAGRYHVAAVRDEHAADWRDPLFLQSLVGVASTIDLVEGQRLTQSLRVAR